MCYASAVLFYYIFRVIKCIEFVMKYVACFFILLYKMYNKRLKEEI